MLNQRIIILEEKYYIHPDFSNYATSKDGKIINVKTRKNFKKNLSNSGYHYFRVYSKNLEKPRNYACHRFVYETIKGFIPEGFEIHHKNENKIDNRIKNLEMVTHQKNVELSKSKKIICINIENNEKKIYLSIKLASIDLEINAANISSICSKRKYFKTATSKKDGNKYTFKALR